MNKILFFLISLILFNLYSKPIVIEEEYFIHDPDHKYLDMIDRQGEFILDHLSSIGYELYGPKGTGEWLSFSQINYSVLDLEEKGIGSDYQSFDQMTEKLKQLVSQHPDIAKLYSIGKSVEGRDLWVVKISDNVEVDEVEPEFKYISTMHGDEIVGRELMVRFIEDILKLYDQQDCDITSLVNNTEIFIMPSMNPDGTKRKRRGNAKGRDLNRSFPDFTSDPDNSWDRRPQEVIEIMKWQLNRNFSLSANFHGGAVVVNYPWDTTYTRHPFDRLVTSLSREYASYVPEMRDSNSFADGITNGADWYSIDGGMQDWSYYWHGDLQVTVELSMRKWPSFETIDHYYQENRFSLQRYIERVHQGAGFYISDNKDSEGTVEIFKINGDFLGEYGFTHSEFYKVLEAGDYLFKVKTKGKINKEFDITVSDGLDNISNNGNYLKIVL
jgi:hypothetical protein